MTKKDLILAKVCSVISDKFPEVRIVKNDYNYIFRWKVKDDNTPEILDFFDSLESGAVEISVYSDQHILGEMYYDLFLKINQ